jgi:hypothetical protein
MVFCCYDIDNSWQVSDIADIASIIIAIVNLFLAGYIFIYQRDKDNIDSAKQLQKEIDAKKEAIRLQEQNIRLQWFKELIIQPHISEINLFYTNLYSIEAKLNVNPITDDLKIETSEFVKANGSILRKSFIDILHSVSPQVHSDIKNNIDDLIDQITTKIIDAGLNLNDKPTFDREIGSLISYSHNDLISKIYSYKGI